MHEITCCLSQEKISKGEKVASIPINPSSFGEVSKQQQFIESEAQKEESYRNQMQEEVKRISSVYNEEQQKLDLMMKMQQARQRQNLQRKLLERKRGSVI